MRKQEYRMISISQITDDSTMSGQMYARYIKYTYKIPTFAWSRELSVLLKGITCSSSLSDIQLNNMDTVREMN